MPFFSAIRVHQWVKNLLVFVPLIAAHRLSDRSALISSAMAFIAFSACASAIYLFNDWMDLESDRQHPTKKHRPLASGQLGTREAKVLILLLLGAGLGAGSQISKPFVAVLAAYLLITTGYTLFAKKIVLLDVFILAGLYSIRIFAGSIATGIPVSEWLMAFSMFFFLSLALAKRFAELRLVGVAEITSLFGRGYSKEDLEYIPIMGICSGFMTSLVMALYINTEHVRDLYRTPAWLWLVCPVLLYWIARIWLLCHRGKMRDDPVVFAITDVASYVALGLLFLIMALAR